MSLGLPNAGLKQSQMWHTCDWHIRGNVGRSLADFVAHVAETL